LAFSQGQTSLKVGNPGRVFFAVITSTRSRRNPRIESTSRGRSRRMRRRVTVTHQLQKEIKEKQSSERQHKTSYEENIFTYEYNPMTKVLGLYLIGVFTFERKCLEKLQGS
jgi:hypothetical protein